MRRAKKKSYNFSLSMNIRTLNICFRWHLIVQKGKGHEIDTA